MTTEEIAALTDDERRALGAKLLVDNIVALDDMIKALKTDEQRLRAEAKRLKREEYQSRKGIQS